MTDLHTHARTDELTIFWVPLDIDLPMQIKVVSNSYRELQALVAGSIEEVPRHFLTVPDLECGCELSLFVNEEAKLRGMAPNYRLLDASKEALFGDAFFVGKGLVSFKGLAMSTPGEETEVDMFSLPQSFAQWGGPGMPVPTSKQPWEEN